MGADAIAALARLRDVEHSRYLKYGFAIRDVSVAVRTPEGRWIGDAASVSSARRIVRAHRRVARLAA